MQQHVVLPTDTVQYNQVQVIHPELRANSARYAENSSHFKHKWSPHRPSQASQKQVVNKMSSSATYRNGERTPLRSLSINAPTQNSARSGHSKRHIQLVENEVLLGEANTRFRSAAKHLALLSISPHKPQHQRYPKALVNADNDATAPNHDERIKINTSRKSSPRKLLWPDGELRSHQTTPITAAATASRPLRQTVRPSNNLQTPHRFHVQSPETPKNSIRLSNRSHAANSTPTHQNSVYLHETLPYPLPKAADLSRFQKRFDVPDNGISDPKRKKPPRMEHMKQIIPFHLQSNRPDQAHAMGQGPMPNKDQDHAIPSTPVAAISTAECTTFDETTRKTGPDLRFYAARILPSWQVWTFRALFGGLIICLNTALLVAYFYTNRHLYLLAILAFVKSKDLLCTMTDMVGITFFTIKQLVTPTEKVSAKWIASLICAYAETEEQIMKTFRSLAEQDLGQHKQVVCIILDGKNADILSRFTEVHHKLNRTYFTWKGSTGDLSIHSGFIGDTATILIRKIRNAGKKDSLILGHDMFNYPRADMPRDTSRLRREIFRRLLPSLTKGELIENFEYVFCTDADSTIHAHSLKALTDTLSRREPAIAACGVLVAELAVPKLEWTAWHLYQQFQYTFGQYVRRQAEGIWGRVTCLPGCITMIKVRPEMGKAISMYAQPVTNYNILEHQVQYLGTDRRLTYCILAQGKHLKSLFVPGALCETVVPDSLEHYLSQRRRWASNAYFNDYYYAGGGQQFIITRLIAVIDIVRQTLVFYRVINTGLFIYSLVQRFYIIKIVPTLILTKLPATWFMLVVLGREQVLRKRMHKLFLGMCINQLISPFLSVIVFVNVLLNVGSQVWGTTGVSSQDPRHPATPYTAFTPQPVWSPGRLASIVRNAVRSVSSRPQSHNQAPETPSQYQKPIADRLRAGSMLITPKAQQIATASRPDSELRYRTSVLSPQRQTTDRS